MKTAIRSVVLIYVLSVMVLSTAWSSICDDGSTATTLVYVNGIDNDRWAAISSMVDVTRKVKEYIANNPLESGCLKKSRLAYNHNELFLADLTQSAIQAGIEQIERFWRFFANLEIAPDWFQEEAADSAMNVGINDADVNEHVGIYKEEISSNNNVVVVSHSQGNFYANRAYDDLTAEKKDALKIVAVATPSHFVAGDGPYTTLFEDFIANFVFPPTRLAPNIQNGAPICEIGDNWACHSFIDSYILGVKSGPQIMGHIIEAISATTEPRPMVTIDFDTFPDGTSVPEGVFIINQYSELGVIFTVADIINPPGLFTTEDASANAATFIGITSPNMLTAHGHTPGPFGGLGCNIDLGIEFLDPNTQLAATTDSVSIRVFASLRTYGRERAIRRHLGVLYFRFFILHWQFTAKMAKNPSARPPLHGNNAGSGQIRKFSFRVV